MRIIKVLLVNLLVFLILAVTVELVFGYWFFGPDFGYLNVKINQTKIDHSSPFYPPGTEVVYRRDQFGLRGNYGSPENITILTVGGSTTNDRVINEGDTWSDILQSNLQKFDKNIKVANAGIDGHSTVGHIRSFDLWFNRIPQLSPRYILFSVGINDTAITADNIFRYNTLSASEWRRRISNYVKNHSVFLRGYGNLKGFLAARRNRVAYEFWDFWKTETELIRAKENVKPSRQLIKSLNEYSERLKTLNKIASDFGGKLIYVTQPVGLIKRIKGKLFAVKGTDAGLFYYKMKEYNRVLMEFCISVNAICMDLAKELTFNLEDFYDRIHTTPSGSRKIGAYLSEKMSKENF